MAKESSKNADPAVSVQDLDFDKTVKMAIRSRFNSRHIQFDVFTFSGTHVAINVYASGDTIKICIPYIMYANGDDYTLLFRNTEVQGSMQTCVSYLSSTLRREQSKLSKFKN